MLKTLQAIAKHKIVPVVALKNLEDTLPTMAALSEGGLPIAEITLRADFSLSALKQAVQAYTDMLIGAGTVITAQQCRAAIDCGARFIVSPGLSVEVANVCKQNQVLYIPGVITPTEIIQALSLGLTSLKFFPAESFGGIKTIKALSAAFSQVNFMPTGGINEANIKEYLSFNKVIACGGSFMIKDSTNKTKQATKDIIKTIKNKQC